MKTILIVDDEEDLGWYLKKALRDGNPDVDILTTRSGEEALDILDTVRVDLVITDVRMPGISGIDLLSKVREMHPRTGVIVMTSYAGPDLRREVASRGGLHFVEKPFDIHDLRGVVRRVLDGGTDSAVAEVPGDGAADRMLAALAEVEGVSAACIIRRNGSVINSVVHGSPDMDTVGVRMSEVFIASDVALHAAHRGGIRLCILEGDAGSFYLRPLRRDLFLLVIAGSNAHPGVLMAAINTHCSVQDLTATM